MGTPLLRGSWTFEKVQYFSSRSHYVLQEEEVCWQGQQKMPRLARRRMGGGSVWAALASAVLLAALAAGQGACLAQLSGRGYVEGGGVIGSWLGE